MLHRPMIDFSTVERGREREERERVYTVNLGDCSQVLQCRNMLWSCRHLWGRFFAPVPCCGVLRLIAFGFARPPCCGWGAPLRFNTTFWEARATVVKSEQATAVSCATKSAGTERVVQRSRCNLTMSSDATVRVRRFAVRARH